jgi:hypothetical protein
MPGNIPLGYRPETHETLFVPDNDRFSGTYILGVQGSGKSGLLQSMIHADLDAGNAVIVIDPHGDLVDSIVAQLPVQRIHETFVLDMDDENHPFGLNLFSQGRLTSERERSQVTNRISHLFKMLWPETEQQQHLPTFLRLATIALLSYEGATLAHLYQFLVDAGFRAKVLGNSAVDHSVRQFWHEEYDKLSDDKRKMLVAPLTRRLHILFTGRSLVRNIVGQPRTTISFRRAIENKEVILVKLPVEGMEEEVSLVGKLIVAQLSAAVFSFADMPPEQRPSVSIYVDEFPYFAVPDFAKIFSEGRKFGARVTIVHQYRTQIPEYLREATKTARNKVVFQAHAEDAKEMAQYFPNHGGGRLEKVDPKPLKTLLSGVWHDHEVREFIEVYLRTLIVRRIDGENVVAIENPGIDWGKFAWHGLRGYKDHVETPLVDDPRPYLDQLLREVMESGNPNYPIPYVVATGLSNGGRGFFKHAKKARGELSVSYAIPPGHIIGGRWVVEPRNSEGQFYHFIFHLRAAMRYLAANPLGTMSQGKPAVIAQQLITLPRRSALVRAGDAIGMIQTYDIPPKIMGSELTYRVSALQHQTHLKYCHSRAEVEHQQVVSATDPIVAGQELSGWGKVGEP